MYDRVCFFGAGKFLLSEERKGWFEQGEFEIVGILDNDEAKWGGQYLGKIIMNPMDITGLESEIDYIVLTVQNEIIKKDIFNFIINKLRIAANKIKEYTDIQFIPDTRYGGISFDINKPGKFYLMSSLIDTKKIKYSNDLERFYFYGKHKFINKALHYLELYNKYFNKLRGENIVVLEIGVQSGGSLQMWKDYFGDSAQIVGVDIDSECLKHIEDRIAIEIGSQQDEAFLDSIGQKWGGFDIIIDDGGHTMQQEMKSFQHLWKYLRDGGVYSCEDLSTNYLERFSGAYKGDTFVEFSKNRIDDVNYLHISDSRYNVSAFAGEISAIHYHEEIMFIEKQKIKEAFFLRLKTAD